MTIQATRIGDYYFPVFGSEVSVEQSLYTNARTSFNDVIVAGYGNCGLCGLYYYWGERSSTYADAYNYVEASVRAINILRGLF
ncbi:MAG: hypothetical protein A2268_12530 [Candidatus Raymondbacteria bacterium RifOxyA12_full_50_37]|uniref:Uncharacterized protein n=1 Tax=Candidatus Raymondbacteria bacterium RIFOXYD12_FULL_49_13 TaxID=1817890 RepID=A0A1F7F0G0_UNCRA|nr:MAG: hypothetical protein A2248_16015 [Candidatus Raymondbacteria bacterium RIFOXYA2_FULL_49_16]OGJ91958.1 MAG: hypothetical protein A2268_12530 [Candidatus Raymondbacteria bacterium RifOxyA12_full_50_37]OGJ98754.1 MAG: hypothetical protein A2487_06960 [Candidatus Raymondbacteria bacterium RifOxyC12_full_50_8]OGK00139.1 MAG: hypothetical protein A2519_22095 [Candidatus Raymondbacteria bacterium RIFOXYD12_FULL_49_13]OGP40059.1 MAG: hypothetical protein A2324_00105 [Candidatus Raymondbacteria 